MSTRQRWLIGLVGGATAVLATHACTRSSQPTAPTSPTSPLDPTIAPGQTPMQGNPVSPVPVQPANVDCVALHPQAAAACPRLGQVCDVAGSSSQGTYRCTCIAAASLTLPATATWSCAWDHPPQRPTMGPLAPPELSASC